MTIIFITHYLPPLFSPYSFTLEISISVNLLYGVAPTPVTTTHCISINNAIFSNNTLQIILWSKLFVRESYILNNYLYSACISGIVNFKGRRVLFGELFWSLLKCLLNRHMHVFIWHLRAYSHQRCTFFSAAEILLRIYQNPIHLDGARWRTTFFRRRNSRCLQNLVRQRVPFKCMGFWYIRCGISAAEKNVRLWCE